MYLLHVELEITFPDIIDLTMNIHEIQAVLISPVITMCYNNFQAKYLLIIQDSETIIKLLWKPTVNYGHNAR